MKKKIEKFLEVYKMIYGYSIMISLFAGVLIALGYLVALIVGNSIAVVICDFIYLKVVPIMVFATSIIIVLGIVYLYLAGEKTMTSQVKQK